MKCRHADVPICCILGASKSGYFAWRNSKPSARKREDERLEVAIKAAHERGRGTYGPEKLLEELAEVEKYGSRTQPDQALEP